MDATWADAGQQCVRCEREQLSSSGRHADSVELVIVFRQFAGNANLESQIAASVVGGWVVRMVSSFAKETT